MEPLFLIRPTDVFTRSVGTNLIKNFILGACSWAAVPVARRYRLTWPQYVIGIIYSGQMTMEAALAGIAASRRNGGNHIEVVFHIGRADESERDRWGRRKSIAQFYCSALRDSENEEVTKLATYLNREGFIM